MKIGRGVSELWRVENRSLPCTDLAQGLYNSLYYRKRRDYRKPKHGFRRKITTLVQLICHLAMSEGFDSFYNDVNYDEVTKTHNMQLCAL